jgi:hypothetical protein
MSELVTRALIGAWLFLVAVRFGVAPRSPAQPRPAPRSMRRQWAAVMPLGGRVVGVRLQVVLC